MRIIDQQLNSLALLNLVLVLLTASFPSRINQLLIELHKKKDMLLDVGVQVVIFDEVEHARTP